MAHHGVGLLDRTLGHTIQAQADQGFLNGLHAGCRIGTAVCLLGVTIVLALLPARPGALAAIPIPNTA